MISILIQNIIFVVLVAGLGIVLKILNGRIKSLWKIFIGVVLLWLASIYIIAYGFNLLSGLMMIFGVIVSLSGLISLSSEVKLLGDGESVNSIESALNSILKKTEAEGGAIFYIDQDKNSECILKSGKVEDGCVMLIQPIYSDENLTGYLMLFGNKPFVGLKSDVIDGEINLIKLYIENRRLNDKIKSIQKYIHLITHELRKPLTSIIGFSEILRDEFKNLSEKDVVEFISNIKQSGDVMLTTLRYLSEITEIELGEYKLKYEKFNPVDEVKKVVGYFSGEIEKKNLNVEFDVENDFEIEADRKKFNEILYQLVSNAVKFSRDNTTIKIVLHRSGNYVELRVKDEGIGIRGEDFDKIFKPFPKIKTHLNGSGLGLVLVKLLVELHGGEVDFESEFGKGSEFRVLLPLKCDSRASELVKEKVLEFN